MRQHADGGGIASLCKFSRRPLSHRAAHADSSPYQVSTGFDAQKQEQ